MDFDRLDRIARERREEFAMAEPYPHLVIDEFLDPGLAEAVRDELLATREGWDHYHHYNERKQALTRLEGMGPRARQLVETLHAPRFVGFVEQLAGLEGLRSDPELDGAGLHRVLPGGYLNVHTDFLSHTRSRRWSRQINLLVYFNRDWKPEWNGALELWHPDLRSCARAVEPEFNRCVLFRTSDHSFHGHPRPLACPPDVARLSLALYYYREEPEPLPLVPTRYRALPGDPLRKRALVALDGLALHLYTLLKRYAGLSDGLVSRLLKRL